MTRLFAFNAVFASSLVFSMMYIRGMEDCMQLALQTREYNKNHPLIVLPEITGLVLNHCHTQGIDEKLSLGKSIRTFIRLSCTCNYFNTLLTPELIGNFCKNYSSCAKDWLLTSEIENMSSCVESLDTGYLYNPLILIMIHSLEEADQKQHISPLLGQVILKNNIPLLKKLYAYKVNLNISVSKDNFYYKPLFFYAKTIDVVKLFINDRVNLHATDEHDKNVLWHVIANDYSAELILFYLKQGIDVKQLNPTNGFSLLHSLVLCSTQKNIENSVQQAYTLLNAMPDMVNTLNNHGQSPLYLAHYYHAPQEIIKLFKIYGGRVIPKYKPKRKTEHDRCVIS